MKEIYNAVEYIRVTENSKKKYICKKCGKIYKCRASVRTHCYRKHPYIPPVLTKNNKTLIQNYPQQLDKTKKPEQNSPPFIKQIHNRIIPTDLEQTKPKTIDEEPANKWITADIRPEYRDPHREFMERLKETDAWVRNRIEEKNREWRIKKYQQFLYEEMIRERNKIIDRQNERYNLILKMEKEEGLDPKHTRCIDLLRDTNELLAEFDKTYNKIE